MKKLSVAIGGALALTGFVFAVLNGSAFSSPASAAAAADTPVCEAKVIQNGQLAWVTRPISFCTDQ